MANAEITVSVERSMHDALAALAQRLSDEFGTRLNSAYIVWYDAGSVERSQHIVAEVRISSTTDDRRKPQERHA